MAGEAAAVSEACEMAGLGGQSLRMQLGGRMHQARAQALKAKRCIFDDIVDSGDGAEKLSQAIDEALKADNPDEAMARMAGGKGRQPPCGATRASGSG